MLFLETHKADISQIMQNMNISCVVYINKRPNSSVDRVEERNSTFPFT